MARKSSVLLIYTGGTIGMKTNPETGALSPFDFKDIYDEFPYLRMLAVDIEVMMLEAIDSSNVTPALWIRLAEILRKNYGSFDGFVILHGTDTMSYTASALSFALENLSKPVVFTGSQIPIGVLRTDGRENLITAIEIAAARDASGRAVVPEVCLYFQNRLLRANRTTKHSAEELDAFRSENYPPLAEVGVSIHYNHPFVHPAPGGEALEISTAFDTNVAIIKIFPGLTRDVFSRMLHLEGIRGFVLETYGSGNAPTSDWFLEALREAIAAGKYVLNVTQCEDGSVAMEMYETGIRMQRIGVVSGHDITSEAAVAKLMYLLGKQLPANETTRLLATSLRGEMSV